jgi:YfiH family protein
VALILSSELLSRHGFAHGFSLRTGGVSKPPFDTLNLARTVGDDPEAVAENARRFAAALASGGTLPAIYEVSQVHGSVVREVEADEEVEEVRRTEADALVVAPGQGAVAVRTADCVPVLVGDRQSRVVAAIHAGWRGTVRGVIEATFEVLRRRGVEPRSVVAAIGPHIRLDAFEVGRDVAREIAASAPGEEDVIRWDEPRPHVDLSRVVRSQLEALGVPGDSIDDTGGCTFTEAERFFSYRRDHERSGRHLSAIAGTG